MSIFGFNKKKFPESALKDIKNSMNIMNLNNTLLYEKVQNIPDRKIISIYTAYKGDVGKSRKIGFGENGSEVEYIMNYPGQIIGMSARNSAPTADSIYITINVNDSLKYRLNYDANIYGNFETFYIPLKVEAGDAINFVIDAKPLISDALSVPWENASSVDIVISLIIELFL